jgi:hypothetical protein
MRNFGERTPLVCEGKPLRIAHKFAKDFSLTSRARFLPKQQFTFFFLQFRHSFGV